MRKFARIYVGLVLAFLLAALLGAAQAEAQTVTLTALPSTRATVTIPSSAILTAQTAPVSILPAQAGFIYIIVWQESTLAYNSATYSSTACGLYYHGSSQLAAGANINSTIQATQSVTSMVPGVIANNVALANASGLGVDFACTTGNPTTGNSPLKIVIEYVAVPL